LRKHSQSELRKTVFSQRNNLDLEFVAKASSKISKIVCNLPVFIQSKNIGYYSAISREVDTVFIEKKARKLNKNLFLPVVAQDKKSMQFYSYTKNNKLYKNIFNILEVDMTIEKLIDINQLDLIFVPVVAFDQNNNRLGRGAGFYDRYLESKLKYKLSKPVLIGLAYEFQKVDFIQTNSWDVPMDFVVTEKSIAVHASDPSAILRKNGSTAI